jgi:hypothetical protein
MLMENTYKQIGIHHSATDLILVIARSAAIPRLAGQSPGTQALNFRRLLRFARNDSHPDTLTKTFAIRFGQHILRGILILTPMRLVPPFIKRGRGDFSHEQLNGYRPADCSIDFSLFVFYCPNVGCLKSLNFEDGPRPVWKHSFDSRYRRIDLLSRPGYNVHQSRVNGKPYTLLLRVSYVQSQRCHEATLSLTHSPHDNC